MNEINTILEEIVFNVFKTKSWENLTKSNCAEWTSLNHIIFISDLENALKLKFTLDEIESINTIKDVISLVKNKK